MDYVLYQLLLLEYDRSPKGGIMVDEKLSSLLLLLQLLASQQRKQLTLVLPSAIACKGENDGLILIKILKNYSATISFSKLVGLDQL
jgi:hypothetical protein